MLHIREKSETYILYASGKEEEKGKDVFELKPTEILYDILLIRSQWAFILFD